jgi:hypothetical protein
VAGIASRASLFVKGIAPQIDLAELLERKTVELQMKLYGGFTTFKHFIKNKTCLFSKCSTESTLSMLPTRNSPGTLM